MPGCHRGFITFLFKNACINVNILTTFIQKNVDRSQHILQTAESATSGAVYSPHHSINGWLLVTKVSSFPTKFDAIGSSSFSLTAICIASKFLSTYTTKVYDKTITWNEKKLTKVERWQRCVSENTSAESVHWSMVILSNSMSIFTAPLLHGWQTQTSRNIITSILDRFAF